MISKLLVAVRVIVIVELLLGVLIWTGHPVPWRGAHLALGLAFGATVLVIGAAVTRATRRGGALLVSAAWTLLVIAIAIVHPRLWPGGAHWAARTLHVLTALATLGVLERIARGARTGAHTASQPRRPAPPS